MKNIKFLNQYKEKELVVLNVSAIQQGMAQTAIPEGTQSIQITFAGIVVTATGAAVAAAAGDDASLTVSIDGVHWFSPGSVAGTAVVLGCDDGGRLLITDHVNHIRLTTALIQATETVSFHVACVSE